MKKLDYIERLKARQKELERRSKVLAEQKEWNLAFEFKGAQEALEEVIKELTFCVRGE